MVAPSSLAGGVVDTSATFTRSNKPKIKKRDSNWKKIY